VIYPTRHATSKLQYTVKPEDLLSAGDMVMCRYTLQILNCEAAGGAGTCAQHGMLTCRFDCQTERMVAAEFVFDVMGFMQQLQVRSPVLLWLPLARACIVLVHSNIRFGCLIRLQMCWGISPEGSIVPNTLESAMQPTKEVRRTLFERCLRV
jgi:hypothetical protein